MNGELKHFNSRKTFISRFRTHSLARLSLLLFVAALASSAFGQTLTTLYSFGGTTGDGEAPGSGVIADKSGNLFGTTGVGGIQGSDGTVFELKPPAVAGGAWTETILHKFHGTPDGKIPESRLAMNAAGAVVGTTVRGGADDTGAAYMLTPPVGTGAWKETILHDFGSIPNDVASPNLGVVIAPEGIYGVDQSGENLTGAFYLLTRPAVAGGAWTQTILYSFQGIGTSDASGPTGEPVRDVSGNFYGVTAQGGTNNLGAVYEISPPAVKGGAWTETVLHSFDGTDGSLPSGRLLLRGGVLYGTASSNSGNGAGAVFQLTPPTVAGGAWTYTNIHAFSGSDGSSPETGVIADPQGRLLGTAGQVIFALRPPKSAGGVWKETVLHSFAGPDGFLPSALTLFKNAFYGTTSLGGGFGTGTVFQLTIP